MKIKRFLIKIAKPLVERFPKVAMTYRNVRDNLPSFKIPKKTPMGFKFAGHIAMQKGSYELVETNIIQKLFSKIDVFINIGANIGYYCCHALQQDKDVIAFEPMQANLRYLYQNIKANHWEQNIEVYPLALSDRIGLINIYGGGTGASFIKGWANTPEHWVNMVPTSTLDTILGLRFQGKKKLILVDIEGAELQMLKGAKCILNSNPKPIWMVEIQINSHQPKGTIVNPNLYSTFQLFWDYNYEAWTVDQSPRLINRAKLKSIAHGGEDTLSVYNFIFFESNSKSQILGIS